MKFEFEQQLSEIENNYPESRLLIIEVLQLDPLSKHELHHTDNNVYILRLYDLSVGFKLLDEQSISVLEVMPFAAAQIDTPGR